MLRPYGDCQSYKLQYKYLSKVTGVPARLLAASRAGRPPLNRKSKPNLDKDVLSAMPEFQHQYLEAHSNLGLPQRVALLNQAHPDSPPWTTHSMRTAYRRLGIKHKVVRINRTQRRSDQVDLIARDKEYLQIMQEHLLSGPPPNQLILIDECVFSAKSY